MAKARGIAPVDPQVDETYLGAILVRQARVPLRVLQAALDLQAHSGGKIGEILLAARAITEDQLADALAKQAALRAGAVARRES
jgi:hypothetical protein